MEEVAKDFHSHMSSGDFSLASECNKFLFDCFQGTIFVCLPELMLRNADGQLRASRVPVDTKKTHGSVGVFQHEQPPVSVTGLWSCGC